MKRMWIFISLIIGLIAVGFVLFLVIKERKHHKPQPGDKYMAQGMGIGMSIGMGFGVAMGIMMDNFAIGVAIGPGVGAGIGVAIGQSLQKKHDVFKEPDAKHKKIAMISVGVGMLLLFIGLLAFFYLNR